MEGYKTRVLQRPQNNKEAEKGAYPTTKNFYKSI